MRPEHSETIGETDPEQVTRLRLAVMRLARLLRQEAAGGDVTQSQLSALSVVDRCGPVTLGHLAEAERVQPPTMTRIAAHLEEAGLVLRTPDPADRRSTRVAITTEGRRLLERNRSTKDAFLHRRTARLAPEQRNSIADVSAVLEALVEGGA